MFGQQARFRQLLKPSSSVLLGNPKDLRNFVCGSEGAVMLQVLQDVGRAPLREPRGEVVDDRLERLCREYLPFDDPLPLAVPNQEREEVHPADAHLVCRLLLEKKKKEEDAGLHLLLLALRGECTSTS